MVADLKDLCNGISLPHGSVVKGALRCIAGDNLGAHRVLIDLCTSADIA